MPTSITYPNGNTLNFTLTPEGKIARIQSSTVENNNLDYQLDIAYQYDGQGNLVQMTDSEGIVTNFQYTNGRLTQKQSGAQVETYTYDNFGNIVSVTDALGHTTSLSNDAFHRLTQATSPEGVIMQYQYDQNNNITLSGKLLGATLVNTSITYDVLDNPTRFVEKISSTQSAATSYEYNNNEQVIQKTYPNGMVENYQYDELNRVKQKQTVFSGKNIVETYGYDANSNLISHTRDGSTYSFTYDLFDRLIQATDPLGNTAHYEYDKV